LTFSQWESQLYPTLSQTGVNATPLNDGVSNLLKYLCDINPITPMAGTDRAALPIVGTDTTTKPGTQYLTLTYRQYASGTGLSINTQTSSDLQNWTTETDLYQQVGSDAGDPIMEIGVITPPATTRQFIRLQVVQPTVAPELKVSAGAPVSGNARAIVSVKAPTQLKKSGVAKALETIK
jgi:hypothetical protein